MGICGHLKKMMQMLSFYATSKNGKRSAIPSPLLGDEFVRLASNRNNQKSMNIDI